MAPSRITLVAHTHWDREWYHPFETFRARLLETMDEAVELLERDPRLSFTLDGQMALVDDYLELRPEALPRLRALCATGQLHAGPFYTQADTLLVEGEPLVRNLVLGLARARSVGGALRIGYLPDQFGHAAQLPQLLRRAGIDGAVLWRGVGPERPPHAFRWESPDGSDVTVLWLQDGYGSGRRLPSDPNGFADAIERALLRLEPWLGELPILVPVGDDHVRLPAWLPEAARTLAERLPRTEIAIGGYHHHLPLMRGTTHTVRGELRSPAFAPVLAAVASARIGEKLATAGVVSELLASAEPLSAWVTLPQLLSPPSTDPPSVEQAMHRATTSRLRALLERAWRLLVLNQAHDSAAGCGSDEAHQDVQARTRWARQLGHAATAQALERLGVDGPSDCTAWAGADEELAIVEFELPSRGGGPLEALGTDGQWRLVQPLGTNEAAAPPAPLFEGEFGRDDLGQYLGGLDPTTPLFGRYVVDVTAWLERPDLLRIEVWLGPQPVEAERLAAAQRRVVPLVSQVERVHVRLLEGGAAQRALLALGPMRQGSLAGTTLRSAQPSVTTVAPQEAASAEQALSARPAQPPTIDNGLVRLVALERGAVRVERGGRAAVTHLLFDEGDRGDLYHSEPIGEPLGPIESSAVVEEAGPLRWRLSLRTRLVLPRGLEPDRQRRQPPTESLDVSTTLTLLAGSPRVECALSFDNSVEDHRLRVCTRLEGAVDRLEVEHGLAVLSRPLDPGTQLGHGSERAAPTGQHHGFVDATLRDASGARWGVALLSNGLLEHELSSVGPDSALQLTLVRGVGWLSRGDLSVIDHAAGPLLATPGAQERGELQGRYALILHECDWESAALTLEARRHARPPRAVDARGPIRLPPGRGLVEVSPPSVCLSALYPAPEGRGLIVRLVQLGRQPVLARLRLAQTGLVPLPIDLEGAPRADQLLTLDAQGAWSLPLAPFEIATLLLAPAHRGGLDQVDAPPLLPRDLS
jgi:alpha-mannosidase